MKNHQKVLRSEHLMENNFVSNHFFLDQDIPKDFPNNEHGRWGMSGSGQSYSHSLCKSSHLCSHRTPEGDADWCQRIQSTNYLLNTYSMSGTGRSRAFLKCRKGATVKVVTEWYHIACGMSLVGPLLPALVTNPDVNAASISRLPKLLSTPLGLLLERQHNSSDQNPASSIY